MSKKSNTVWFIILATILNIVLMMVFAVVGYILVIRFANPESPLAPILLLVVLILSIVLSWLLYSKIIKILQKKWNLDDKIVPLLGKNAHKNNRQRKE